MFYADGGKGEVWRFEGVGSEGELVTVIFQAEEKRRVEPDEEGPNVLVRILKCDEAVIPVSADRVLDYSPIKSMPWEEDGFVGDVRMSEEEGVELFKTLWWRSLNGMSLSKRLIAQ